MRADEGTARSGGSAESVQTAFAFSASPPKPRRTGSVENENQRSRVSSNSGEPGHEQRIRSVEEKKALLGRYLGDVDGLVKLIVT